MSYEKHLTSALNVCLPVKNRTGSHAPSKVFDLLPFPWVAELSVLNNDLVDDATSCYYRYFTAKRIHMYERLPAWNTKHASASDVQILNNHSELRTSDLRNSHLGPLHIKLNNTDFFSLSVILFKFKPQLQ